MSSQIDITSTHEARTSGHEWLQHRFLYDGANHAGAQLCRYLIPKLHAGIYTSDATTDLNPAWRIAWDVCIWVEVSCDSDLKPRSNDLLLYCIYMYV